MTPGRRAWAGALPYGLGVSVVADALPSAVAGAEGGLRASLITESLLQFLGARDALDEDRVEPESEPLEVGASAPCSRLPSSRRLAARSRNGTPPSATACDSCAAGCSA
jgi:hypothetical protein